MLIANGSSRYAVHNLVAKTEVHRLYLCTKQGDERGCLLQIATETAHNGALDRAAHYLRLLATRAEQLETEYERVKPKPHYTLGYHLTFPELVDSFVADKQGGRRINVLAFRFVTDPRKMVPLWNIVNRDELRIDTRSSAWIMGKLLKILAFVHDSNITIGRITLGNILIEPDQHYVLVFNWADATHHVEGVRSSLVRIEIQNAAKAVIDLLGGNTRMGEIPPDTSPEHAYINRLMELARYGDRSAATAHDGFYKLVDSIWERGFYPFTTLPR